MFSWFWSLLDKEAEVADKKTKERRILTIDEVNAKLEQRCDKLKKLVASHERDARKAKREGKKMEAIRALKRKKVYEKNIEQLTMHLQNIDQLKIAVDTAEDVVDVYEAFRSSNKTLKDANSKTKDVEGLLDNIRDSIERQAKTNAALSFDAMDSEEVSTLEAELGLLDDDDGEPQETKTVRSGSPVSAASITTPFPTSTPNRNRIYQPSHATAVAHRQKSVTHQRDSELDDLMTNTVTEEEEEENTALSRDDENTKIQITPLLDKNKRVAVKTAAPLPKTKHISSQQTWTPASQSPQLVPPFSHYQEQNGQMAVLTSTISFSPVSSTQSFDAQQRQPSMSQAKRLLQPSTLNYS